MCCRGISDPALEEITGRALKLGKGCSWKKQESRSSSRKSVFAVKMFPNTVFWGGQNYPTLAGYSHNWKQKWDLLNRTLCICWMYIDQSHQQLHWGMKAKLSTIDPNPFVSIKSFIFRTFLQNKTGLAPDNLEEATVLISAVFRKLLTLGSSESCRKPWEHSALRQLAALLKDQRVPPDTPRLVGKDIPHHTIPGEPRQLLRSYSILQETKPHCIFIQEVISDTRRYLLGCFVD